MEILEFIVLMRQREPRKGQTHTKSMAHPQARPLTPPGKVPGYLVMLHLVPTERPMLVPAA